MHNERYNLSLFSSDLQMFVSFEKLKNSDKYLSMTRHTASPLFLAFTALVAVRGSQLC